MSALILLGAGALWLAVGWAVWAVLVSKRIRSLYFRRVAAVMFLAVWIIAPWLDELIGARQFEHACAAMPAVTFTGPVSVGAGPFFDHAGRPKWRDATEFEAIQRESSAYEGFFEKRSEVLLIESWPIPIRQQRTQYLARSSNTSVLESFSLVSPGGWFKRATGWGWHAPYQCPPKGRYPPSEQWIKF